MKGTIKMVLLAAVFAPFLMTGAALIILPDAWNTLRNTNGMDWVWFILLAAMMLGLYYFLAVYLEDEDNISVDFQRLDTDHDGFITRDDAKKWPDLLRAFGDFDKDNDGRLSHIDFEAFENTVLVRKK